MHACLPTANVVEALSYIELNHITRTYRHWITGDIHSSQQSLSLSWYIYIPQVPQVCILLIVEIVRVMRYTHPKPTNMYGTYTGTIVLWFLIRAGHWAPAASISRYCTDSVSNQCTGSIYWIAQQYTGRRQAHHRTLWYFMFRIQVPSMLEPGWALAAPISR